MPSRSLEIMALPKPVDRLLRWFLPGDRLGVLNRRLYLGTLAGMAL